MPERSGRLEEREGTPDRVQVPPGEAGLGVHLHEAQGGIGPAEVEDPPRDPRQRRPVPAVPERVRRVFGRLDAGEIRSIDTGLRLFLGL